MKRGELRRKTPLRADAETTRAWQRRSQDAARARERTQPARSAADVIPAAVRRAVLERAHGRCEAQLEGCTGTRRLGLHHRLKRRSGLHTEANLVALCADCHTDSSAAVHRNVAWSESVGLLLRSSEPPPTVAWQRLPADGD